MVLEMNSQKDVKHSQIPYNTQLPWGPWGVGGYQKYGQSKFKVDRYVMLVVVILVWTKDCFPTVEGSNRMPREAQVCPGGV